MSHIRRTWIVENKWTCSSCSAENLGRHVTCQQCGNPKEQDEQDSETIDPSAVVTDQARLDEAAQAAHWTCPYCDGKQRDPDGNCTNCGGAKATPNVEMTAHDGNVSIRASGGSHISNIEVAGDRIIGPIVQSTPAPRKPWPIIGGIGGGAVIIGLLIWLLVPHEFTARVSSMKWIHMARYEERLVRHGEGWGSPIGSFNDDCRTRYYGTENCHPYQCNPHSQSYSCNPHECNCHTSCKNKKNGYSSCSEHCSTCYSSCSRTVYSTCYHTCPVYRSWCSYDYYDWVGRGEQTLMGQTPESMTWPDMGPIDASHRMLRVPAYIVNFESGKDQYSYAPSGSDDFSRFRDGQTWTCEKRVIGMFKPLQLKDRRLPLLR